MWDAVLGGGNEKSVEFASQASLAELDANAIFLSRRHIFYSIHFLPVSLQWVRVSRRSGQLFKALLFITLLRNRC